VANGSIRETQPAAVISILIGRLNRIVDHGTALAAKEDDDPSVGAVVLFVLAMSFLAASLICLLFEVRIAVEGLDQAL
jgi:hypothetical protein